MSQRADAPSNHTGGRANDTTHHSPDTSILGAPTARARREGPFNDSENMSQHSSDEEYEGQEQSESTWLSRAHSRVEELRRLFNLPPSEVKPSPVAYKKVPIRLPFGQSKLISPSVWHTW